MKIPVELPVKIPVEISSRTTNEFPVELPGHLADCELCWKFRSLLIPNFSFKSLFSLAGRFSVEDQSFTNQESLFQSVQTKIIFRLPLSTTSLKFHRNHRKSWSPFAIIFRWSQFELRTTEIQTQKAEQKVEPAKNRTSKFKTNTQMKIEQPPKVVT